MTVAVERIIRYVKKKGLRHLLLGLPSWPRLARVLFREMVYQRSLGRDRVRVAVDTDRQRSEARNLTYRPVISVIVPTYRPRLGWLRECVDSVLGQSYPFLELCLSDDASNDEALKNYLDELRARDPRVKIALREENGHICFNTNSALALASGDFVAFVDHDDALDPRALFEVASALNAQRDLDFIYTDEDKMDEGGQRSEPARKPEFSRELFYRTMFTGHLAVYRKSLVDELQGLRPGSEGAQDWDLLLRALELRPLRMLHVPKILYHWRKHAASTSSNPESKPYAHEASYRVLTEHFERTGTARRLISSPAPGFYDWA